MMMAGREFLEKTKKIIRATLTVELPYDNELLNYGTKLNQRIRDVIDNTDFLCCSVESGNLKPNGMPIIKEKE